MTRIILATLASVIALSAQAAVQQQTVSFGPALTDFTTATLTVTPFDTSLGQLTSVSLGLSANSNVSGSVTNTGAQTNTFRISTSTAITLTSVTATGISGLTVSLGAVQDLVGLAPGATRLYEPAMMTGSKTGVGTPLSAFTAGPISFVASTSSLFVITGAGGNSRDTLATTAGGALVVTYTYDEFRGGEQPASIPEPASLAMLGAGLLCVGALRRRV